jgi:hypothetical protein
VPGPEVARLLKIFEADHGLVEPEARQQKVSEAQRILRHGPRSGGSSAVGLALGFVQSGKTMSFTTLAALAADTGYRLVIVILGNTHLLVGQNTDRLLQDLRIDERDDWLWAHRPMPRATEDLDFFFAQDERVVLVTVLKHAKRLNDVASALERSTLVGDVDALIVDDEADQASLNAGVKKGKVTPTYKAIQRLRTALPRHLYVQYTATPFAPLLLEPHDDLSPDFLELLTPGTGYTGGSAFFIEHRDAIVRRIGDSEAEEKSPDRMPTGLAKALNTFLASAALLRASGDLPGSVSMLIHTSGMKVDHSSVAGYVKAFLEPLRSKAASPEADLGRQAWLRSMQPYRQDLVAHGCTDVADDAFASALAWCVRMAKVWIVNSGPDGEQPDWKMSPVNVLIGGNKLDRGFTVNGLTTTYMTRRASRGQADTIEQRARCYGYKRDYIRSCRVFAPTNVIDAFTALVHTEADMRASLQAWVEAGRPLSDWSAEHGILLPDDLRPTRPTVLRDPYDRGITGWSFMHRPDLDETVTEANRKLLDQVGIETGEVERYGEVHATVLESVPVEAVVELILEPWRFTASPGWDHPAITRGLRANARAGLLVTMSVLLLQRQLKGGELAPRERYWSEPNGFGNLMQGANPGTGYPGDRSLRDGVPQLQAHRVARADGLSPESLALALYVPQVEGGLHKVVKRG